MTGTILIKSARQIFLISRIYGAHLVILKAEFHNNDIEQS